MVKDDNKDSSNSKLILVLIALLILLILAGGYLAFSLLSAKQDATITTKEKNTLTQVKTDKASSKKKKKVKSTKKKTTSTETSKEETKDDNLKDEQGKTIGSSANTEIIQLTDIVDITKVKSNKKRSKKEKKSFNALDQMPNRTSIITTPFAFKKEVLQIDESNFADLQKESLEIAGKFSPFDIGALLPELNETDTNKQTSSLPEIPDIPDTISLPPGLSENILSTGNLESFSNPIQKKPKNTNSVITSTAAPSTSEMDSAVLTGIIGDSAIIKFNGESRALHVGQNHKGIVVLSISDKSVLLQSNGVKVIKELRDRF